MKTVPEMFAPAVTSLGKPCGILRRLLKEDNTHWDTEALGDLGKCQSCDFIVTVHIYTGMPAHLRLPEIISIPILNEPRWAEAPSTTRDAKDTWCRLLRKINPTGPWDSIYQLHPARCLVSTV